MPAAFRSPPPAVWPFRLTAGQWVALSIEAAPFPSLAAKVDGLRGAADKVLWLAPSEVEALRRLLAGWARVRGSRHARRCRDMVTKLQSVQSRVDRAAGR